MVHRLQCPPKAGVPQRSGREGTEESSNGVPQGTAGKVSYNGHRLRCPPKAGVPQRSGGEGAEKGPYGVPQGAAGKVSYNGPKSYVLGLLLLEGDSHCLISFVNIVIFRCTLNLWYIVVVTPLSSVYRIMFVICDAFAGPDLVILILSYHRLD